jgi:hypothetical protein
MANYAVTDWSSVSDSVEAVAALMETKLETIDDTKSIRYIDILRLDEQKKFMGVIIYDA